MKPRVIVFDLDNTLFETRSLPPSLTEPIYQALRESNCGDDSVSPDVLEQAFEDSWSIAFPLVVEKHGLPQRMLQLWHDAHRRLEFREPLQPFPDVTEVIPRLSGLKFLLTSGYRRVQNAKIDALGIRSLFDMIIIDAVDDDIHRGKEAILRELLQTQDWSPEDLMIVGDSSVSELLAGRRLGIPTVQIFRPGVIPSDLADRQIHSLFEL
jgi:FMN phosphatase YigB (HAD superfamily)